MISAGSYGQVVRDVHRYILAAFWLDLSLAGSWKDVGASSCQGLNESLLNTQHPGLLYLDLSVGSFQVLKLYFVLIVFPACSSRPSSQVREEWSH